MGATGTNGWPQAIVELAAAATEGRQAVTEAAVRVARPLLAADGAALVHWQDGDHVVLSATGSGLPLEDRLPEGPSWSHGHPVAAVSVDPRTDLVVSRSAPLGFGDSDLEKLRALGELVSRTREDRTPDALLHRFAARIVSSLEIDEVLVSTADAVSHLLRAEIAGVLLRSSPVGDLEMRCAIGNTKLDTSRLRIRPGQGLAGRVLESGRSERIDDYATDPRSAPEFLALSDIEGTCSALAVPLRWEHRTTGVLCAWRRRRAPFTDDDEALFEELAALSGAAIHNATSHQAARSRVRQCEAEYGALRQRHDAAERDLHVHAELTRIAIEGEDVGAVVRTVSGLTKSPAVVVTDDGRILGSACRGEADQLGARLVDCVPRAFPAAGDRREPVAVKQDDGSWLLVAQVRAAGVTFGHLGLALAAPPTSGDRLAGEQAAVVIALLLAREEAGVAAARRVQSEFVWDLLEGRLPDSVEAGVRARHLGIGFALPARVVAVEVSGLAAAATAGGWNAEHLERARSACAGLISAELARAGVSGAVLARRADLFALVVPCASSDTPVPRRLAHALATVHWPDGLSATAGVGGTVEQVTGFPAGWREARLARSAVGPDGEPGIFEDLGVLQFLLAPTSRVDLDVFARRQLGPLIEYDRAHGTELMTTLLVYLAADCGTRRTAELLCMHHRTVSYRLQRIADLTGLRLDDQEDRFRVQLACKILGLGSASEPCGPEVPTTEGKRHGHPRQALQPR